MIMANMSGKATCSCEEEWPVWGFSTEEGTTFRIKVGDVSYCGIVGMWSDLRCWICSSPFEISLGTIERLLVVP